MNLTNLYWNINSELKELIINFNFLFALVLVSVIVLIVKKIMLIHITERKIDESLRETRARISRAVTEIEEYTIVTPIQTQTLNESTGKFDMETLTQAKIKGNKQLNLNENVKQDYLEQEVPYIQEISGVAPREKKTRAMSMEERWAEYDKKRSMRSNTGGFFYNS